MKVLYTLLLLVLSPLLFLKFPKGFLSRIFPNKKFKKSYYLHCSSLGEVNALLPFINHLKIQTKSPIILSVFTKTGFKRAKSIAGITTVYLPLDFAWIMRGFLKKIKPQKIFILETEFWPNLLNQAYKLNIDTFLINARLSDKSLKKYKKHSPKFFLNSLQKITHIFCQSEADKKRFLDLNIVEDKITITGNIKFDISLSKENLQNIKEIKKLYNWDNRAVFLAASVREGEEELVINSFQEVKSKFPNTLLIIAPRHIKQFSFVEKICNKQNLTYSKRSNNKFNKEADVFLLDTLGELMFFYDFAKIIFVGGSIKNYGGHNVIEAAIFNAAIVVGQYMQNSEDVIKLFKKHDAITQVKDEIALSDAVIKLFDNKKLREKQITNAHKLIKDNKGQIERIAKGNL